MQWVIERLGAQSGTGIYTQCSLSLQEQRRLMRNRKGDTIDRKEKALGNEQAESPRSVSPVGAPKAVDKQ